MICPKELPSRSGQQRSSGETQVCVDWNTTEAAWPRHCCAHELFEMQADRTPQAVAVVYNGQQLTYSELNKRANQLAHRLVQMTSGMDVPIGLFLEPSLERTVGLLAILKSGAAYLPLDPAYPPQLLQHMLGQALAPVVLTKRKIARHLPRICTEFVFLDSPFNGSEANLPRRTAPGNLASIIFTSGSVGLPKAVAIPHRPIVNLATWYKNHPSFSQPARTLQLASPCSDIANQEIFSTWATGGTLVLKPEKLRRNPQSLLQFLTTERIERLFLPFPALQHLAEAATRSRTCPQDLRDVVSTGEPLRITPPIASFFGKISGCQLHNHYSSAESHAAITYTLSGPPSTWPLLPAIGQPISNTKVYLLDANRQPVQPGATGEIFIEGECLAQGYLYRPNLTATQFEANPIGSSRQSRLFRTGDAGRYTTGGLIEYLGRVDSQWGVPETSVSLSTVDAFLSRHPLVSDCMTIALGNETGEARCCTYVVARHTPPAASELRDFLQAEFKRTTDLQCLIPSRFIFLSALPFTPNHKVDRHRLTALDKTQVAQ